MKNKFVFIVISYNQEEYILQTLNSIKYQVEAFGQDYDIRLIIGDDCSIDRTVIVAKKWIEDNKNIFKEVKFIEHRENVGTVSNYMEVIREVNQDEAFAVLAADDLFSAENVIRPVSEMEDYQILSFPYIELVGNKIDCKKKYLYSYFYKLHTTRDQNTLWRFMKGSYLHSPSTFFSKKIFDESKCDKFIEKYKLFEDDPILYKILQYNNGKGVNFQKSPVVIYRTTVGVSNTPNSFFLKDYKCLQEQYINDSKGIKKLYFKIKKRQGLEYKKITLLKVLNKFENGKYYIYSKIIHRKKYKDFENQIYKSIQTNQAHYEKLISKIGNGQEACDAGC